MNINIKAKLRAYTKGIIPVNISQLYNDLNFIPDAPDNGVTYGRKNNEWVDIDDMVTHTTLAVTEDSGLNLAVTGRDYVLNIKKYEITQSELPSELEADTTYYVLDQEPNNYINGGTAFSSGNNDYIDISEFSVITNGGHANTQANILMYPINAEGVYNG